MGESDQASGGDGGTQAPQTRTHKRILRAVFAADIAGFSSKMSLNETSAVSSLSEIRTIGLKELETHNGWLFGMPGDGFFALFESAVGAVQCGLEIQRLLSGRPHLGDMPLRIGIHLGEVLMDEGLPYGETLNIAARLESLCKPGEMLVSGPVMDAVSARVSATFEERGVPRLKNIPRRVSTFAVKQPPARTPVDTIEVPGSSLDRTTRLDRDALRRILDEQSVVQIVKRDAPPESEVLTDNGEAATGDASAPSADVPQTPVDEGTGVPTQAPPEMVDGSAEQMGFPVPIAPEQTDEQALQTDAEAALGTVHDPTERLGVEPTDEPVESDEPSQVAAGMPGQANPTDQHVPLQVPEFDPELQDEIDPQPEQPSEKCIEMITKALAVHVGPFSKLIVERYMKGKPHVYDLIALLETHIPSEDERTIFRVRASHICKTFGHSTGD